MVTQSLQRDLCAAFCDGLSVHTVPAGLAVSSAFEDDSGDRITFYVTQHLDGLRLEDDGDYLATLVARDIPITYGTRAGMLDAILREAGAFWDHDTFEIRTETFEAEELTSRAVRFLSGLIRVRDLALVTREKVKSAFREDFLTAISSYFGDELQVQENVAPSPDLAEFPADVVLRPRQSAPEMRAGAVYLVNSNDKLNEALLAWHELADTGVSDTIVLAVIEDADLKQISHKRFQRAQNRALPMPIFRGDELGMARRIARELGVDPVSFKS